MQVTVRRIAPAFEQLPALSSRPGWVIAARTKTGTPRRAPLWGETVSALATVEKVRPDAADPSDADCVFLTQRGNRWVRFKDRGKEGRGVTMDAVAGAFGRLAKRCGVKIAEFYSLQARSLYDRGLGPETSRLA